MSIFPLRRTTCSRAFLSGHRFSLVCRLGLAGVWAALLAVPAQAQLDAGDIQQLRARGAEEGWSFSVGLNPATDYAIEELCGLERPDDWQSDPQPLSDGARIDPPASLDWRELNGCTPVRNQAGCGSCWAFGATGAVECAIKIMEGYDVDLSEQWLVSTCSGAGDCNGGWPHDALNFFVCFGTTDPCGGFGGVFEEDLPYLAQNSECECPFTHPYCIVEWGEPEENVPALKEAIYLKGPIVVGVYVSNAFAAYTGGVFDACENGPLNHAVVLVGWDDGDEDTPGHWIMRNSWSAGWGEGGYMRIKYNCNGIGSDPAWVSYVASDCNENGLADTLEIAEGTSPDCNGNLVPDECDLAVGTSQDCNSNGIPDDCDIADEISTDCNHNGVPDDCDIASGESEDCNGNGKPDECDNRRYDCNGNYVPDDCDIADGVAVDCNGNGIPDECDVAYASSMDCNGNGIPDECDLAVGEAEDCDGNGVPDACDLGGAFSVHSGQLTPFDRDHVQTFVLDPAPLSLGAVTLHFQAYADLNFGSEYVDVYVDGEWVDEVFNNDVVTNDCPYGLPDMDATVLSAEQFNAAAVDGVVVIEMNPSRGVAPEWCFLPTWIAVELEYEATPVAFDCNANGVPDVCDIAAGEAEDANGNNIPDACELPATCRGDCNCDGERTFADIRYFAAALNSYSSWVEQHVAAGLVDVPNCPWANCDVNADGAVGANDVMPFVNVMGVACP